MPISDHKIRRFTEHDKLLFRAGVLEGERRVQYRLALLETTNRRLWEQLCELDKREPLVDVRMSMREAEDVLSAMTKYKMHTTGPGAKKYKAAANWLRKKVAFAREIELELLDSLDVSGC